MADGQDTLNQLQAAPVNPVQTIPSAPSTGVIPNATAADVLAGIQAAQTAPQPANLVAPNLMQAAPNLPAQTAPDVSRHVSFLHRVLDTVGTILGGGETLHATKDADGNMSVTRSPSTTSEKWGRVAAAALSGAAQGLANAQGPGGMARAASAGIQTGMQMPQQQEQQVQQEVNAQNQQLLQKANRIRLQQDIARQAWDLTESQGKAEQDQVDRVNALNEELHNSPWHDDVGVFKDLATAMQAAKDDPQVLKNHAQAKHRFITEYNPDMTVRGIHVYNEDPSYAEMRNADPLTVPELRTSLDPSTGKLVFNTVPHQVDANTMTHGDIANAQDKYTRDVLNATKVRESEEQAAATAEARRAATEKTPYELGEIKARTAAAEAEAALRRSQIPSANLGAQGLPTTTASGAPISGQQFGGGDPNSSFEVTARQLAEGMKTEKDIPSRTAKGGPNRQDYSARAAQIHQELYGQEYNPAQIQAEYNRYHQPKTQAAYDAMNRMTQPGGQLDQFINTVNNLGIAENLPLIKLPFSKSAADYDFQKAELTKSLALITGSPLLGSSDTNTKLEQMENAIARYPTPANLKSVANQIRLAIGAEQASGFKNNRFLRRAYGGEATVPGTPSAAAAPSAAAPAQAQPNTQQQPQGQQPTLAGRPFDATIYHNVHPDKNLQQAVDRARAAGMNVLNLPSGVR